MDNTHPAKSYFTVFIATAEGSTTRGYTLTSTEMEFPNHEEARIWIEDHGERKNNYVILEIFRKD